MLTKEAQAELERKLQQARSILTSIMEAGDSGSVSIHYGASGLQIKQERTEKPVPVNPVVRKMFIGGVEQR